MFFILYLFTLIHILNKNKVLYSELNIFIFYSQISKSRKGNLRLKPDNNIRIMKKLLLI